MIQTDCSLYNVQQLWNTTHTPRHILSLSERPESALLVTIVSVQVLSDAQFMHSNSTYTHHCLGQVCRAPQKKSQAKGGQVQLGMIVTSGMQISQIGV